MAPEAVARPLDAGGLAAMSDRDLQALFAAVVRAYAERATGDPDLRPFLPSDNVTATDVAVAATGMLEATNMAVFELGMWQTIKGRG